MSIDKIEIWFKVKYELFLLWWNRKDEYRNTIAFFVGMYFREKRESNKETTKEIERIGIIDIQYENGNIIIECLNPVIFDIMDITTYMRNRVKEFNGYVRIRKYSNRRLESLYSYRNICKDFNDNDEFNYDY